MRAILASIASTLSVLQAKGSTQFKYQFSDCTGVKSGTNMPKRHDGVAPINEPCYSSTLCNGSSLCCATVGTCEGANWRRGQSAKSLYEGGCNPDSVNSSHPDYDPSCTQVGECNVAYLFLARGSVPAAGTMTELPKATLDRLMAGSNWCSHSRSCQNTPCSNFSGCTGVQSGLNLAKVSDGVAPLNEPCHSRRLCDGSIWCCATVGTCVPQNGERGVFVGSNKAFYEGGCSPASLDDSHQDYDPECKQQGECHHPFILLVRNGFSAPGAMTLIPGDILARLMAGSNWHPATQTCGDGSQFEQDSALPPPSHPESSPNTGLIIALAVAAAAVLGLTAAVGGMYMRMKKSRSQPQTAASPMPAGEVVVGHAMAAEEGDVTAKDLADKEKGFPKGGKGATASGVAGAAL